MSYPVHIHGDMKMYGDIKLYAGSGSPELAQKIADYLQTEAQPAGMSSSSQMKISLSS